MGVFGGFVCTDLEGVRGAGRPKGIGQVTAGDVSRRSVLIGAAAAGGLALVGEPALATRAMTRHRHPRFPGDPGRHRLYYGENREGGDSAQREQYFGHPVGIYRSYWQASQTASMIAVCYRDLAVGRLPFPSTKLPATWAEVASGSQDAWLRGMLNGLAAVPGPVWLCLHHEPYDDQGAGQTVADYVAMYRHVYPLKPANVAMVPILQSAPFDTTVYGHADITPWYDPSVTDVVGIDSYNHWYPGGTNRWRDPATMALFFDVLAKFGKPIALAEYGVRTDPANPGRSATWMRDFRNILIGRGDVVAMSFFDSGQNVFDGGTSWALDAGGETERLHAFKTQLTAARSAFLRKPQPANGGALLDSLEESFSWHR